MGDFIDRGKQNRKVISLIRRLRELNLAYVILGNHELNAIYFHSENPTTGLPLRKHSLENIRQHQSFLEEFPLEAPETEEIINWFCSLPVFFGHYWMAYPPKIESKNALCLDCSAGTTGPLISYFFDPRTPNLDLKNVTADPFLTHT